MNSKLSSDLTVKTGKSATKTGRGTDRGGIVANQGRARVPSGERAADGQKLVAALPHQGAAVEAAQARKRAGDRVARRGNGRGRIAMRAAGRLAYDFIDYAEAHQVLRGDAHARRGLLRLGGVAPQDRCRALG